MVTNLPNICFWIGAVSTVLFVVKTLALFICGADTEVEADFDSLTDTDTSFHFFSIQSILAFLMGFGWVGLAMLTQFKLEILYSILVAFLVGVFFMYVSAYLMCIIRKLDHRVRLNMDDYVGTEGRSYSAFKSHSIGQVEVTINKKLMVINAINSTDDEIEAFVPIKIVEVKDKQLYIAKV